MAVAGPFGLAAGHRLAVANDGTNSSAERTGIVVAVVEALDCCLVVVAEMNYLVAFVWVETVVGVAV